MKRPMMLDTIAQVVLETRWDIGHAIGNVGDA